MVTVYIRGLDVGTWLNAVRIDLLQLLDDSLQLVDRTTCDGPFQVRGKMVDNVLSAELPSVACWSDEDEIKHAVLIGSHGCQEGRLIGVDD